MRLIGMLDSPYVRRVAVSMKFMRLPFEHESVSVFRQFDLFAATNPVVKAPTLVADDGTVLMDSELILGYLNRLVPAERQMVPVGMADFLRMQRIVGLALAACEKSVQLFYELTLRPAEKLHRPWLDRVAGQVTTAYRLLESEIGPGDAWIIGGRLCQADITVAVAWRFTQFVLADRVPAAGFPTLERFSAKAEALPEFVSTPLE